MRTRDGIRLPLLLHFLLILVPIRGQGIPKSTPGYENSFDLELPVVFQGPKDNFQSHLGWSTTLLSLDSPQKSGQELKSWILIGDPKGNVTSDPSYRNIYQPGVVWKCSLLTDKNDRHNPPICEEMKLDIGKNGAECRPSCPRGAPHHEYHSNNWVGGNIVSSSSRFVISSHRWHRGSKTSPYVNGLAYWFKTSSLQDRSKPPADLSHRLIPFFHGQSPNTATYDQYDGYGIPRLAFGEAGIALHLTPNGELLMGASGLDLFRGGIVRYTDYPTYPNEKRQNVPNRSPSKDFSGFRVLKKRNRRVTNEYFGYAVTSGKFIWERTLLYAGGSPKGQNLLGEVLIFDADERPKVTIKGTQFGSYFGSVLTSINANKEEKDELLIGAPMFDESITTGDSFVDHGAVYLYSFDLPKNPGSPEGLIRITSGLGRMRGGRFGAAIVNLGDINEDGMQDFAIGAPFENGHPNGEGAVYIFHGKENLASDWRPVQRITPNSLNLPTLKGFGCTFSRSVDIDQNYTPDLAIGSFLSKSVVLLRTRPALNFFTSVTYYTKVKGSFQRTNYLNANAKSFQIKICLRLKGKALEASKARLRLLVTLSMDTQQSGNPRFTFAQRESKTTFHLDVDALSFTNCKSLLANLQQPLEGPLIPPIHFDMRIKYEGEESSVRHSPVVYEIQPNPRSVREPSSGSTFAPLLPFPREEVISLRELNINSECANPNKCVPKLKIDGWWVDLSSNQRIESVILDWEKRIGIYIEVENDGEPAYDLEIELVFKSSMVPKLELESLPDCQVLSDRGARLAENYLYRIACREKTLRKEDKPRVLQFPATFKGIYAKGKTDYIVLEATAWAKNDDSSRTEILKLELVLNADVNLKLIGSVTPPNEAVSIHYPFIQHYEVILTGTSPLAHLGMDFKFPLGKGNASLLTLEHPTGNRISCTAHGQDFKQIKNPNGHSGDDFIPNGTIISSRRRRDASVALRQRLEDVERILPNENMTLFGCGNWDDESPGCLMVKCSINEVRPNEQLDLISFNMKLETSRAVLLGETRTLLLESLGSAYFLGESEKSFAQTIVQFNDVSMARKIPLWVYILSGLGGLILLILIMWLLYKTGFFKRNTKIQLEERKAEVEVEERRRASMMENPNQEQEQ